MGSDINLGTVFIIGLVLGGLIGVSALFLYNSTQDKNIIPEDEVSNKALLDVKIYSWAENLYDDSEMFFDYFIYNYGDIEAKNIVVRCNLYEDDYKTKRVSATEHYGNLASKSFEFGELITDKPSTIPGEEFTAFCYVESCDDCEILNERIPKLVETYS